MPNEMIERAARALDPEAWDARVLPVWPTRNSRQAIARDKARAVIASLREPSEAVEDAGCDLVWEGVVKPAILWTAMIDAILTEEGETR